MIYRINNKNYLIYSQLATPRSNFETTNSMEPNVHGIVVHLHPVAAFSIVDSHERRPKESQTRVIGSLLGVKNEGIYEASYQERLILSLIIVL